MESFVVTHLTAYLEYSNFFYVEIVCFDRIVTSMQRESSGKILFDRRFVFEKQIKSI